MEEKEWNPSKGDFHKRSVHQDHQKFKKRAKIDKVLLYFFIVLIIGVILFGINSLQK